MGSYQYDIPWTLIEPEDPAESDMVDVSGKWTDVPYSAIIMSLRVSDRTGI